MSRDEILKLAAKDDPGALSFLTAYARRAHYIDDLVDSPSAPRDVAFEEASWAFELCANQFFLAHREKLLPLMLAGMNAWADSNRMEPGPIRDVVKGYWHEVIWHVAFIRGGWSHMREVSGRCREYDIEHERSEPPDEPRRCKPGYAVGKALGKEVPDGNVRA